MPEPMLLPIHPSGAPDGVDPARQNLYAALVENERKIRTLQGELAAQDHLAVRWRQKIDAEAQVGQALRAEIGVRKQTEQALRAEIAALTSGGSWRLVQALRRCRLTVAPPGTRRGRLVLVAKRVWQVWRQEGARAVVGKLARKVFGVLVARSLPPTPIALLPPPSSQVPPAPAIAAPDFDRSERLKSAQPLPASFPGLEPPEAALLSDILSSPSWPLDAPGQPIDVLVPVYKGLAETLRCLGSLLAAKSSTPHEIIVINDASPDSVLVRCLDKIAQRGYITLLENPANLGFVKTVNRGLALHPGRDVVLLNSDTEVYADWLHRLQQAAYAAADVGTVTPLSNNATICSYPAFFQDNPLPADVTPARLDELCATQNRGHYVNVPVGVGFCIYLRRSCLNQVGPFNEEHFGKGYGEENDFCMRARASGWRHVLTTDTFVYHAGGTSFGGAKDAAIERANQLMYDLHPDYGWLVSAHRIANPAHPFRRRLDLARLTGPGKAVLYVTHGLGGGTERHVVDMATRLEQEGVRTIILRPVDAGHVRLERLTVPNTPNLVFALPGEYWTLREALRALGVQHVHIHHTIFMSETVFDLIRDLKLPYDWTIHDYYSICPRVNLIDESGAYCGEPGPARCNLCLERNGGIGVQKAEIVQWRRNYEAWFAGARKVIVPHQDVATRLGRYFPDIAFTVRQHFVTHAGARLVGAPLNPGEPLRVAVLGVVAKHKGAELLLGCARDACARELPLCFHVVGYTDRDELFRPLPNVSITGQYREEEVFDLLGSLRCHCAFFASVCPETYSYTLSLAFLGGLFPISFDLGAPAARIRESGIGHVMPLTTDVAAINDELVRLRGRLTALTPVQKDGVIYEGILSDYYGLTRANALPGAHALSDPLPSEVAALRRVGSPRITTEGKLRVLFIFRTGLHDACNRYRVFNVVEALQQNGIDASHSEAEHIPVRLACFLTYDLIVLARCPMDERIALLLDAAEQARIPVIYDMDDYLFDEEVIPHSAWLSQMPPEQAQEAVQKFRIPLERCLYFTGSTDHLAERASAVGKHSYRIKNGLNVAQLEISAKVLERKPDCGANAILRIGYFSGSHTHQADFRLVSSVLLDLLREFPFVHLVVAGALDLGEFPEFGPIQSRIERPPYVDWHALPAAIGQVDINLIPLVINPFTEGKSELKYYEAGLLKIPSVASPTKALAQSITHGSNGFLARTPEEWYSALERLIVDPRLREQMGLSAYQHVLSGYVPQVIAREAVAAYSQILRHHRRRLGMEDDSHAALQPPAVIARVA